MNTDLSIPGSRQMNTLLDRSIIGIIFLTGVVYIGISGMRQFNFDEFQVMYASASLLRGKALYADQIETHFPLTNIIMSALVSFLGFRASTVLFARYFILVLNGITLFYIFRIGELLWSRRTGLIAVALSLCTVVFLDKGIEIRHDVFNSMFNVAGGYYLLRYLRERRYSCLFLSALLCGLAIASTQKALIWSIGIILGAVFYFFRERPCKDMGRVLLTYSVVIPIPLIVCISFLAVVTNESLYLFYQRSIVNVLISFSPFTGEVTPFPYDRYELFQQLFVQNNLFYLLSLCSILYTIVLWVKSGTEKIVIAIWALVGVLFYLTAKRPFYQTFLPTIPVLAVLVGGFLSMIWKGLENASVKKAIVCCLSAFFLFVWPSNWIFKRIKNDPVKGRQMENISFCLATLKKRDKALCFTQNQIFFDPVFTLTDSDCGRVLYDYDPECFQWGMRNAQCKVVIYDYRTRLLPPAVQKKIRDNYVSARSGDILVPGFVIKAKGDVEKDIWIKGYYYTPTRSLRVDGKQVRDNLAYLTQGKHVFDNVSNRPILLIYIFDKDNFLPRSAFRSERGRDQYLNP